MNHQFEPLFPKTPLERALQTFDAEPFFRRVFYVVVAGGVGVGAVAPLIDWERFEWSWTFLAPLAWGVIRAGAGWYKSQFSVNPTSTFWKLIAVTVVAGLAFGAAGCAYSNQALETADGDKYKRSGVSFASKQSAEGRANLVAYPNGSGLEFQIGDSAEQDSQAILPILSALLQAYSLPGLGGTSISPTLTPPAPQGQSVIQRLNEALVDIAELRMQIEHMRLTR